jgi:hypothetical protein
MPLTYFLNDFEIVPDFPIIIIIIIIIIICIFKNMAEGLKRLSQNGFKQCLPHLYSRCQKCIVAQWNSFEEN